MHSSYILSVYFGFHDSCLTISDGKEILLHMEAERYFRKKHLKLNGEQMEKMVEAALDYLSISINDVRELLVASWNNQWSDPVVLSGKKFDPIITAHHSNHLGTMIPAGFDDAIIICADGGSENGTTKIYFKEGNTFTMLEDLDHSIMTGKFYGTITQMIVDPYFIRAHDTYPGKTMGLAALGSRSEEMIALLTNNALTLDTLHVKGCQSLNKKFGISLDYERIWLDQRRCDLAYNAQSYWQSTFMNKIAEYSQKSENIAFVGGCALNVLLNSEVEKSGLFKRIYISPVSGDGGQSLGAILYRYPGTVCRYPFLGRGFGETLVTDSLVGEVVDDLMEHKIIAWYQDRSEAGARSLGHRSFLGLADSMSMKKKLSEEIKGREPYRPVAAIVPEK